MPPSGDHTTIPGQFPTRPLVGSIGGYSVAGPKSRNDDAISGRVPDKPYEMHTKGIVACIADGISTGRNSYKAAQLSVTQFARDYYSAPESWPVRNCASRLITSLNSWFYGQNRSGSTEAEGQVTTFTAMIARSTTLHVVHIGDTRCLRLRDGALTCLTDDHNARFMGEHGVLTRALGIETDIRVDYLEEVMKNGDLYLLTSDGLHGTLNEDMIVALLCERALDSQDELESAARDLCEAALAAGSDDNVSCMLLRIAELPSETLTEAHRRLTSQTIPPALTPGNRIDGWEVLEVLHSSPRSLVYLVRRSDREGRYVLKAPSRNFAENLQYLEAFMLEQWVGRRVENPQVMKILPHEDSRFLYYIAEHVEGGTLRDWMDAHPRPGITDIIPILDTLIRAVRSFHRLGMVHRDLKPENIILTGGNAARIIDFGSVQVAGFKELHSGRIEDLPEGSLNYIAPEVLAGKEARNLSDLFSIAAIVWEMLTGRTPFDLESRTSLPSGPADWKLPLLEQRRPDLPEEVGKLLARALSFDPDGRPQAMSEFLGELRKLQDRAAIRDAEFVPLLERGTVQFWRGWALVSSAAAIALAGALIAQLR